MSIKLWSSSIALLSVLSLCAQQKTEVNTKDYKVSALLGKCKTAEDKSTYGNGNECWRKIKITIFNQKSKKQQEINTSYFKRYYDGNSEEQFVRFQDVNFDKHQDLLIRDGNNGAYGAETYSYYLYNQDQEKFIQNQELTNLGQNGVLELNSEKQRLLIYSKSGAFISHTSEYTFHPTKGLIEVYSQSINRNYQNYDNDQDLHNGKVEVKIRTLVFDEWVEKTKFFDQNDDSYDF